eukprot:4511582-Prymnesium_polylepis.1
MRREPAQLRRKPASTALRARAPSERAPPHASLRCSSAPRSRSLSQITKLVLAPVTLVINAVAYNKHASPKEKIALCVLLAGVGAAVRARALPEAPPPPPTAPTGAARATAKTAGVLPARAHTHFALRTATPVAHPPVRTAHRD